MCSSRPVRIVSVRIVVGIRPGRLVGRVEVLDHKHMAVTPVGTSKTSGSRAQQVRNCTMTAYTYSVSYEPLLHLPP
ncbi:unnamed protein product [Toxocara canis]|uniref:LSM14 domain-containing protein n=1 Tax=Toxocara canis TaxID=6265 RepID=A0A183UDN6_TOXCA|nr:unnamed protein product [Toxocara canis]